MRTAEWGWRRWENRAPHSHRASRSEQGLLFILVSAKLLSRNQCTRSKGCLIAAGPIHRLFDNHATQPFQTNLISEYVLCFVECHILPRAVLFKGVLRIANKKHVKETSGKLYREAQQRRRWRSRTCKLLILDCGLPCGLLLASPHYSLFLRLSPMNLFANHIVNERNHVAFQTLESQSDGITFLPLKKRPHFEKRRRSECLRRQEGDPSLNSMAFKNFWRGRGDFNLARINSHAGRYQARPWTKNEMKLRIVHFISCGTCLVGKSSYFKYMYMYVLQLPLANCVILFSHPLIDSLIG